MIVGYRFMVIKITPRDTLKNLLLCNNYNNYWRKHVVIFCKIFLVVDFVMNWELPSLLVEYKTEFVPSKIVIRDNYCGWSSFVFVSFFFFVPRASGNTARNSFIGKVRGKYFLYVSRFNFFPWFQFYLPLLMAVVLRIKGAKFTVVFWLKKLSSSVLKVMKD